MLKTTYQFLEKFGNIGFNLFDPLMDFILQQNQNKVDLENKSYLSSVIGLALENLMYLDIIIVTAVKNMSVPDRKGMIKRKR